MRHGLRPPIIAQIFAPPAARSRCLSTFVAIARQSLPVTLRYEPSHLLAFIGVSALVCGFFAQNMPRLGEMLIALGWGTLGLGLIAMLLQDRLSYGEGRMQLIRRLDEARRSVGLDHVILPESLEFLESTAQQWERIEHALQSHVWRDQQPLRQRIESTSHRVMEDIVVLECGTAPETGLEDGQACNALSVQAENLRVLADRVNAAEAAMTTYARPDFESAGVEPLALMPQFGELEVALAILTAASQPPETS